MLATYHVFAILSVIVSLDHRRLPMSGECIAKSTRFRKRNLPAANALSSCIPFLHSWGREFGGKSSVSRKKPVFSPKGQSFRLRSKSFARYFLRCNQYQSHFRAPQSDLTSAPSFSWVSTRNSLFQGWIVFPCNLSADKIKMYFMTECNLHLRQKQEIEKQFFILFFCLI